jgi:Pectate lyase superfamily protein
VAYSPNWATNFEPTAAQWSAMWASKADDSKMAVVTSLSYGALGNGVADDTAAFRAAITALTAGGGTVYVPVPPVSYLISGTLVIPSNVSIVGHASKSLIVPAAANFALFSVTGNDIAIRDLHINNVNKTGGVDILIAVGTATYQRLTFENITTNNSFGFIADSGSGAGYYYLTRFKDCVALGLRGIGWSLTRSFAYLYIRDCTADYAQTPAGSSTNFTGFALDNTALLGSGLPIGGCFISGCSVNGNSTGTGVNGSQGGFFFNNTTSVWLCDCIADEVDSVGYVFANTQFIHINNAESSYCNGIGWSFTSCLNIEASGMKAQGRQGFTATANVAGIAFASSGKVSLVGTSVYGATGIGVDIPAGQSSYTNMSGGQIDGCGSIGLATGGTSAFLATGLTLVGNSSNYSLAGGFQYLQSSQLNSGAVVSVGPGPVAA